MKDILILIVNDLDIIADNFLGKSFIKLKIY